MFYTGWGNSPLATGLPAYMPGWSTHHYTYAKGAVDHAKNTANPIPKAIILNVGIVPKQAYKDPSEVENRLAIALAGDFNDVADLQFIRHAIALIKAYEGRPGKSRTLPTVFLERSSENSEQIAQVIANHTGHQIHLFEGPVTLKTDYSRGEATPVPIRNLKPLLAQTTAVSPANTPSTAPAIKADVPRVEAA